MINLRVARRAWRWRQTALSAQSTLWFRRSIRRRPKPASRSCRPVATSSTRPSAPCLRRPSPTWDAPASAATAATWCITLRASGETWLVDFPTYAPLAAEGCAIVNTGPLAVTVPAVVAGLAAAHARFGTPAVGRSAATRDSAGPRRHRVPVAGRDQVFDDAPRFEHVRRDHARLRGRLGGGSLAPAGPGRDAGRPRRGWPGARCTPATWARTSWATFKRQAASSTGETWRDTHPKSAERVHQLSRVRRVHLWTSTRVAAFWREFSVDSTR